MKRQHFKTALDFILHVGALVGPGVEINRQWTARKGELYGFTARQSIDARISEMVSGKVFVPQVAPGKDDNHWRYVPLGTPLFDTAEEAPVFPPEPRRKQPRRRVVTIEGGERRKRVSDSHRRLMYENQGGYCPGCGGWWHSHKLFVVDHIHPFADASSADDPTNLQLTCTECNREKGDRDMLYLWARNWETGYMYDEDMANATFEKCVAFAEAQSKE